MFTLPNYNINEMLQIILNKNYRLTVQKFTNNFYKKSQNLKLNNLTNVKSRKLLEKLIFQRSLDLAIIQKHAPRCTRQFSATKI